MNRFIRPISLVALLQEVVVFSCLIVVVTFLRAAEKFQAVMPRPMAICNLWRNFWFEIALIPLVWVVLAFVDENSGDPRLEEREHFWIGVGLLILLSFFGLMAIFGAIDGPRVRVTDPTAAA